MVRLIEKIDIMALGLVEKKFLPENMQYLKWYPVVAEKSISRVVEDKYHESKTRTIEDLHFGFIDDMNNLQFVPQFNVSCKIRGL